MTEKVPEGRKEWDGRSGGHKNNRPSTEREESGLRTRTKGTPGLKDEPKGGHINLKSITTDSYRQVP